MCRDERATKAGIYPVERDSNAVLIAAAPEMADALKFLVDAAKTESGMDIYRAHIAAAEKALKKAGASE
jgi:hypothetical protein